MRPLRFLASVERERVQAARYYESRVPRPGSGFLSEVQRVVQEIETHPEVAPQVKGENRMAHTYAFSLCDPVPGYPGRDYYSH